MLNNIRAATPPRQSLKIVVRYAGKPEAFRTERGRAATERGRAATERGRAAKERGRAPQGTRQSRQDEVLS